MSEHELKLKCLEFIVNNPEIEGTRGRMENLLSQVDKLYKFIVKDDYTNK